MKNERTNSRAPMMLAMAAILALPMALTAGIGIYRAERGPARPAAARPAPPADAANADPADASPANGER